MVPGGAFLVYTFSLEYEAWLDYTDIQSLSACSSEQIIILIVEYKKWKVCYGTKHEKSHSLYA